MTRRSSFPTLRCCAAGSARPPIRAPWRALGPDPSGGLAGAHAPRARPALRGERGRQLRSALWSGLLLARGSAVADQPCGGGLQVPADHRLGGAGFPGQERLEHVGVLGRQVLYSRVVGLDELGEGEPYLRGDVAVYGGEPVLSCSAPD